MALSFGPKLGLLISAATGDANDVALRAFLRAHDQLLFLSVKNRTTTAPPGSPANGDAYIVATGGTGAWATHDKSVAVWTTDNPAAPSGEWEFYPPNAGFLAYSVADAAFYGYSGSAWAALGGGAGAVVSVAGRTGAVVLGEADITGLVTDLATLTSDFAASEKTANKGVASGYAGLDGTGKVPTGQLPALGSATLAGDSDVLIASPANNDVLTYETSSTTWKNKPVPGGGSTLAGDTDVLLTSPANNDVLTYETSSAKWKNKPAASGFANPMTTTGDVIIGGASGAATRLPIGSTNQVLTVVSGTAAWAAATGFANPMTTTGDLVLGGASGAPGRLGIGSTNQVLTVVAGTAQWAAATGFPNPMTTTGDVIIGGASGAPGRLAIGSAGQVLTVVSGAPAWATPSSGGAPPAHTLRRHGVVTDCDRSGTISAIGEKAATMGGAVSTNIPTTTTGAASGMQNSTANWSGGYCGTAIYCVPCNLAMLAICRIESLTDMRMFVMLANLVGQTQPGSDTPTSLVFAGFRFSTTASDVNYQCMTGNGSAITTVDSGVAADLNTHQFAIEFVDATPAVKFYIDGTLVATITTHLPPSGSLLAYQAGSSSATPGGSKTFDFEQVQTWADR